MKPVKFFMLIVLITCTSVLYVKQQTGLLELSYDISKKESSYNSFLDQNDQLRYNVASLCSPAYIDKRLSFAGNRFVILEDRNIIKTQYASRTYKTARKSSGLSRFAEQVLAVFTFSARAEAKPIASK